jgi:serine/threonine protein kinase
MERSTTCPSCRQGIFPDDVYCSWCGTRASGGIAEPGTGERTRASRTIRTLERAACHSCNGPILPGDGFCAGCGAQVGITGVAVASESWTRIAREIAEEPGGKYEVLREIGRGGMGLVFLARDRELERLVAIKVLSPALLSDDAMVQRFIREARIIASLRHPSIISIYDVGQARDLRYFVMDYIDGVSISQVLRRHGPLPIPVVETVLYQVGQALTYVHRGARGLVHRDVKPSNVMLEPEGTAVLMDFGISKADQSGGGITRTGLILGTPEYMSPEQCRGLPATAESDQYALGALAYAMLTGRPPFSGPFYQVLMAHQGEDLTPVRDRRPDCPAPLAEVVERMLAKLPVDRWPSISDALRQVEVRPLLPDDPLRGEIAKLVKEVRSVENRKEGIPGAGTGAETGSHPIEIRIDPPPEPVTLGDVFSLRANLFLDTGETAEGISLSWHSTDPGVVRVDPVSGEMEAVGLGPATLFAVGGGLAESVAVEVRQPTVASVRVEPERAILGLGERQRFRATALSQGGAPLEVPVEWVSADSGVVQVSPEGWAQGVESGTTSVIARCGGQEGVARLRVVARPEVSIAAPDPPAFPVIEQVEVRSPPTTLPAPSSPAPSPAPSRPTTPARPAWGSPEPSVVPAGAGSPPLDPPSGGPPASATRAPRPLPASLAVARPPLTRRLVVGGGVAVALLLIFLVGRGLPWTAGGTGTDGIVATPVEDPEPVQAPPADESPVADPSSVFPGDAEAAGPESPGEVTVDERLPARSETPPEISEAPPERSEQPPEPPALPGRLQVLVNPWANVSVGGALVGEAIRNVEVELPPGSHRILIEYLSVSVDTTVVVMAGQTTSLSIDLRR